jgi:hypothetical protein
MATDCWVLSHVATPCVQATTSSGWSSAPPARYLLDELLAAAVSVSNEPIFRERVKKGPENPISVVADKAAARGANPAHDRSF